MVSAWMSEGNLYISAMKSVEIFDRTGTKRGEITLAERPANVAFGDPDRQDPLHLRPHRTVPRPRELSPACKVRVFGVVAPASVHQPQQFGLEIVRGRCSWRR